MEASDAEQTESTRTLHTQIQVNTETAFISYQHTADEPGDVTFNIKDFRFAACIVCFHRIDAHLPCLA